MTEHLDDLNEALGLSAQIRDFVAEQICPYERDQRLTAHGPSDDLVREMRDKARTAGLLTPHFKKDGQTFSYLAIAKMFRAAGWSPLGPVALNIMAPDEGNMNLLHRAATADQQERYLAPLVSGEKRSAFFMTEPADDDGAGSDPFLLKTVATPSGNGWEISGRKAFITGAEGASVGIIMAKTGDAATMFLVDLPHPAIRIDRVLDTIDNSMPGGHSIVTIDTLPVSHDNVLGEVDLGFQYAQIRLAPARLTHCMRWLGCCDRAHDIASRYTVKREAFGKKLIDHEGVGFMLADNLIDLKQCELMIDWCAGVLDTGELGTRESSMAKVAVSELLLKIADRCVQVMGGTGVSGDTIVEQVFREVRAFRIYDGPSEVHRWSLAKHIKRNLQQ